MLLPINTRFHCNILELTVTLQKAVCSINLYLTLTLENKFSLILGNHGNYESININKIFGIFWAK